MLISFVCAECGTRTSKICRKLSYYKGIVIMQCQGEEKTGCMKWHLMADNLHWFTDDQFLVENILNKSRNDPESLKKEVLEILKKRKENETNQNE